MKAVIVAAVSTADKTQDPEVQVLPLQEAARRLGWEVVAVLRFKQSRFDHASEQEVQQAALAALDQHGADVLMVEALDRIARGKPHQTLAFIKRLEAHHGIHFWSRREPFLSTSTDAFREVLIPLFAYIANQESQQKSSRGKAKASFKRQAAAKLGQRATWGRGKMATEDDLARAQALRATGGTVRSISKELGLSVGAVHKLLSIPERASGASAGPSLAGRENGQPSTPEVESEQSKAGGSA